MHKNSSIDNDKIHKAVWNLHPSKAKDDYNGEVCMGCHSHKKILINLMCVLLI